MTEQTPPPNDNPASADKSSRRIEFDYERYAHHLDELDLTEDQAREILTALWEIMVQCVDLGFGIHPIQQATKQSCGQDESGSDGATDAFPDVVSLALENDGS